MTQTTTEPGFTTLQGLIWPEPGVCTERDLYMRLQGPAGLSNSRREIRFAASGRGVFDTWFNLFNLGKWHRHCALENLFLMLAGQGVFQVTVFMAFANHSWERLDEIITLTPRDPCRLNLTEMFAGFGDDHDDCILHFKINALTDGLLTDARWQTTDKPRRRPDLAIAITTFRREAAVARTVERFNQFIASSDLKDRIRLIVTDNGRTAEIDQNAHASLVRNENLGGAGGFARGLLAARDRGASHCLFMDDDASIHMASLERTWQFLAYARDPATAVAGAMINARHRWAIWENGAVFNARCQPLYMGTDLRDAGQAFGMEFDTTAPRPANFYGGWWYFAFAIDQVKHLPFPFFVRGDDVSFSLAHDFNMVTLNGVVSFQESFTDKESPLTWYLDLRSHLAHHLALPGMHIGRRRTLKIAVWFFLRALVRMHYDTLSAINLALEDVIRGPDFFDHNADMATRRADIRALTQTETFEPVPPDMALAPVRGKPLSRLARLAMKVTLNGHLLPFFGVFGSKITLTANHRGLTGYAWGAARITYLSANGRQFYTVIHSKGKLARECWRFTGNALRFLAGYNRLVENWQDGYWHLTSEAYWHRKLLVSKDAA